MKIEEENWYKESISIQVKEKNLYKEICYSVDGGKKWTYTSIEKFMINVTKPTSYQFFFCDRSRNITSYNIKTGEGKLEYINNIAVDQTKPSWNTNLLVDVKPSDYSTDKVSYFSKAIVLTGYAGEENVSDGTLWEVQTALCFR